VVIFSIIGLSNVKTVADSHRHVHIITNTGDVLFSGINIDDRE